MDIKFKNTEITIQKEEIQKLINYKNSKQTTKRLTDYLENLFIQNGFTVTREFKILVNNPKLPNRIGRIDLLLQKDGFKYFIEIDRSNKEWSIKKLDFLISKEVGYENTCIWIRWKSYLNNDLISKYSPNIQVIDIIDVAQRIHIRKENEISMTDEQYLKKCKNFKQKFVKVFFDEKKQFQLERKRKIIWKNISNMNDIYKRTIKRKELFQIKRLIENKNYNEREKLLNNFK